MADQEQPPVCCEGKPASYVCVCGCHAARQLIPRWRKWADEMDEAARGTWSAAPVQRICAAELEDALSSGVKMGDLARYVEYSKRQIKSGPANEAMIRAMGLIDYLAGLAALPAAQPEPPALLQLFEELEIALYGKAGNTWEVGRAERVMDILRRAAVHAQEGPRDE